MTLAAPLASTINQSQPQSRPRLVPTQVQEPVKEPAKDKAQDQEDAINLGTRLVQVPVSASDATGQPVKDLKAEDVVIEEEGRPQQVVVLGEPGKTPVE